MTAEPNLVDGLKDLLSIIQQTDADMRALRAAFQEHLNSPFTKAHPRNGSWAEVLQYLGLDVEEDMVVVPLPAKDNRQEQEAEKVV